uniref:Ephrin-A1 n=1 Tax=Xenopus laevis TaxID=8355 RepID=EFNA1_XENLA|nr:RecName: Full=Ephrin-A1; AltName: Full=EPH-related receptor tyrosine kinase ligand 1; Short=LERK-1; AltName: Full=xELF-a; Flags: Precursor [Xenopus laevis]AAA74485.1 XELF-a [Xenopus laevis]
MMELYRAAVQLIVGVGLGVGLWLREAQGERHIVFWNSSNYRFMQEDYTVQVQLNDYLDIVCPYYEEGSVAGHTVERYTLFLVDYEEYETCKPKSKDQVRWECNKPFAPHGPEKFCEKFQKFTPFTLGTEFREGRTYYYISKPIHYHGETCMRLRVHVSGRTTPPPVNVHTPRSHIQSDEPEVPLPGVMKSVAGNSAAPGTPCTLYGLLLAALLLRL